MHWFLCIIEAFVCWCVHPGPWLPHPPHAHKPRCNRSKDGKCRQIESQLQTLHWDMGHKHWPPPAQSQHMEPSYCASMNEQLHIDITSCNIMVTRMNGWAIAWEQLMVNHPNKYCTTTCLHLASTAPPLGSQEKLATNMLTSQFLNIQDHPYHDGMTWHHGAPSPNAWPLPGCIPLPCLMQQTVHNPYYEHEFISWLVKQAWETKSGWYNEWMALSPIHSQTPGSPPLPPVTPKPQQRLACFQPTCWTGFLVGECWQHTPHI